VLNPGFSAAADEQYGDHYVVPEALVQPILSANSLISSGAERRTQRSYGDELWFRLGELGVAELPWAELDVLDACCGSGFLTFHVLERAAPRSLTLCDLSEAELHEAEELIGGVRRRTNTAFVAADLAGDGLEPESYDVVLGNSFLHHFADVPAALAAIFRLVRPGGIAVGLHEPTPAAVSLESGDPRHVVSFVALRRWYFRRLRHHGPGPVRAGTTDVWLFEADALRALLKEQGFVDVRVLPRYLVRPFVVAALRLHLGPDRPRLTRWQERVLSATVRIDAALRRVMPSGAFGGLSFVARRPR
jgi:ubiquinone/menaquinone biosynthesis C-methylase UbiE